MEQRMRSRRKRRNLAHSLIAVAIVFSLAGMTACGKDDRIKEETIAIVNEKSESAMNLYQEIENLVKDYSLTADSSFTDMKQVLTDMSSKIKNSIQETTEEDGQLTIQELNQVIDNLDEVKKRVKELVKDQPKTSTKSEDGEASKSDGESEATAVPTAAPTETPEPTEEPEVRDLSDLE